MRGSKNEFPPQTGAYAVKVKNGAGWREFDTARLQISVGQAYHEGEKLAATLDWCRHRFGHVIICVNDTLQRFNHVFFDKIPKKEAFELSRDRGNDWIKRNRNLIDVLPSFEIHRWEDWKTWPDFPLAMGKTLKLDQNNAEFRDAVTQNVNEFWDRKKGKLSLSERFSYPEFARLSREYLLEETAIFSIMFRRDKAVDVYPGSTLLPCVIFQGRKVDGAPEGLELGAFTRIDFYRNRQHEPKVAAA